MDDREELERLLGETESPTLTPEGRWRADYRNAQRQRQRRLAGIQPDMFGAPATEHFHRNPKPPKAEDWPLDYDITRFTIFRRTSRNSNSSLTPIRLGRARPASR